MSAVLITVMVSLVVVTVLVVIFLKAQKKRVFLEIEQAIQDKDYPKAEKLIETASRTHLSPFQKKWFTAQVQEGRGEFAAAIESYEKSLLQLSASNYKLSFEIRNKIASLCFEAGMMDKALGYYELILQTHKDHYESLVNSAEIYMAANNYLRAKIQLERVLSAQPTNFPVHMKLVTSMIKLNQYMEAGKHLREIISHPEVPEAVYLEAREMLGAIFIQQKNYIEAVEVFESLLSEDAVLNHHPRLITNLENLLHSLIMQNEVSAALKTFNTFAPGLQENEINELKYSMADTMMRIGSAYQAIQLIHSIYKLRPKFRDVEETVTRYQAVLNAPWISRVFTADVIALEKYITAVLHLGRDTRTVEHDRFLLFIDADHANIVTRDLLPLSFEDCQTAAQLLVSNKASRSRIRYYCFEPLHDLDREIFAFNSFEQITGRDYVDSLHPDNAQKTEQR